MKRIFLIASRVSIMVVVVLFVVLVVINSCSFDPPPTFSVKNHFPYQVGRELRYREYDPRKSGMAPDTIMKRFLGFIDQALEMF